MMPANVGEINNSCFIKAVTGGVMSTLYAEQLIVQRLQWEQRSVSLWLPLAK